MEIEYLVEIIEAEDEWEYRVETTKGKQVLSLIEIRNFKN